MGGLLTMSERAVIDLVPDPPTAPQTRGIVLDKAAGLYDTLMPVVTLWQEKRMNRRTAELMELDPSDRVLDIGCATGEMTLAAGRGLDGQAGGIAIGLDAAPKMIAKARKKIRDAPCRFDIGVAEKLPYADGVFDKVVSTYFFHHLNLEDKLTALCEVHRVLCSGGLFILVDVDIPTTLFGKFCARSGEWLFKQPEIGENIDGKLRELFEPAGFARVEQLAHDMGYVTTFSLRKE
jgi:ubiquinone/menaquinone biosynthesis C-methylase UbiE